MGDRIWYADRWWKRKDGVIDIRKDVSDNWKLEIPELLIDKFPGVPSNRDIKFIIKIMSGKKWVLETFWKRARLCWRIDRYLYVLLLKEVTRFRIFGEKKTSAVRNNGE